MPALATLAVLALTTTTATATTAASPDETEWYGGGAVVAEGASLGVLLLTDAFVVNHHSMLAGPLAVVGLAGLALAGPVNHAVHDHLGRAWGSLGLRLGAFAVSVVGAAIVASSEHCFGDNPDSTCSGPSLGIAFFVPLGVAYVLDDALLARAPVPDPARADDERRSRGRLGGQLVSGGALLTASAAVFLSINAGDVHNSELAVAGSPGSSDAQFNLDKARLGRDIGIGLLVAGLGGLGGGAYLLATRPPRASAVITSSLTPWVDGRGASGLALAGRF